MCNKWSRILQKLVDRIGSDSVDVRWDFGYANISGQNQMELEDKLKEMDYQGYFTLEIQHFAGGLPIDDNLRMQALKLSPMTLGSIWCQWQDGAV